MNEKYKNNYKLNLNIKISMKYDDHQSEKL